MPPTRANSVPARIRDTPVGFVRADGLLAQGQRQRWLLEGEGVPFRGTRVELRVARLPDP